jgi:tetratricopeptide (TPR) repeat protein
MSTKGQWAAAFLLALAGGCGHTLSPAEQLSDEASVKISQGNRTDAEVALRQSIERNPNLPWAHYNLATCLQARRAFDDALAEYRRALDLFGNANRHARSACLYGIAATLDDRNDFDGALKAYQTYLDFAGAAPEEANGVSVARARCSVLTEAVSRGLPSGKPLRVLIGAPIVPAPLPGADSPAPSPAVAPSRAAPAPSKAAPAPSKAAPAPSKAAPAPSKAAPAPSKAAPAPSKAAPAPSKEPPAPTR